MSRAQAKPDGNSLTEGQLAALADRIMGTTREVRSVCASMFWIVTGPEVIARLRADHGLRRCPECNTWEQIPAGEVCQICEEEDFDELDEEDGL